MIQKERIEIEKDEENTDEYRLTEIESELEEIAIEIESIT